MKNYAVVAIASLLASPAAVVAQSATQGAVDLAGLVGQLNSLTAALGLTGAAALPTGSIVNPLTQLGLPTAPANVLQEIMTGVPASVYAGLANPSSRASLASEFQAGHTPDWYSNLPDDAKSYIGAIQTQVATMSINTGALSSLATLSIPIPKNTGTGTTKGSASGTASGAGSTSTKEGAASVARVPFAAAFVVLGLSTLAML